MSVTLFKKNSIFSSSTYGAIGVKKTDGTADAKWELCIRSWHRNIEAERKVKEEENKELTKAGQREKLWSEGERTLVGWGVKDTENTRNGKKFNKSCYTLKMYSLPLTLLPEIPVKF